jgi:hypothetical protein
MNVVPTNNNDTIEADLTSFYSSSYDADANTNTLPTDFIDTEAPPPAGVWNRKNKLLLSLIATSAILCAAAAGVGGVSAHRARMANAANSCPLPDAAEFMRTPSPKSTKVPSVKSTKQPSVKSSGFDRMLTGEMVVPEVHEEVAATTQGGLAYPVIPKTVEHKRKNRVLAEQLGQKEASISWLNGLNLEGFFGEGFFRKGDEGKREHSVRRLSGTKGPSSKSSKAPKSNKSGGSSLTQVSYFCVRVLLVN